MIVQSKKLENIIREEYKEFLVKECVNRTGLTQEEAQELV